MVKNISGDKKITIQYFVSKILDFLTAKWIVDKHQVQLLDILCFPLQ